MHELGIVSQVIDLAAERTGGVPVRHLVLEIGRLSTVLPDAVRFCFDLATEGTSLAGATLEIVEKDGLAKCLACGAEVVLTRPVGQCACGGIELEWVSGTDVRIVSVEVESDALGESKRLARANRAWLKAHGVTMINLMSSPGAGKTTLLERTAKERPLFVIEGDQATSIDGDRVRAAGAKAVQVNTDKGCHLDPHMIQHALEDLAPPRGACVIVENVGNLVCPAQFDLGESERVVVLSTPEGDDKPLKYPHMFQGATLVLLNKMDLLPYVAFDTGRFERAVRTTSPRARTCHVTARGTGDIEPWHAWLRGLEQ